MNPFNILRDHPERQVAPLVRPSDKGAAKSDRKCVARASPDEATAMLAWQYTQEVCSELSSVGELGVNVVEVPANRVGMVSKVNGESGTEDCS